MSALLFGKTEKATNR